ncbi:MAG: long-chain fatty acid--CoA ligase [Desulfuromonadales bacterium]|nr:long-chain fatty acid--CoA ligase [Desulfuromonadales bacterium]
MHVEWLADFELRHGRLLQLLTGKRVALAFRSMPLLAEAILLLDGICEQMLLLPADLDAATTPCFIESSGTTLVLTDQGDMWPDAIRFMQDAGMPPQRHAETAWLLPTSGTTGAPKLISHTTASLSRSVRPVSPGRVNRWGLLYEIPRFAGLQVYLQSLLGGGILVIPDGVDIPLHGQIELFARNRVNALSATPTLWRKLLMTGALESLPLTQITLGGEIATQATLDALAAAFPGVRLTHVYASTEFGVGFSVSDGHAGFPAAWLNDPSTGLTLDPRNGELCFRRGESLFCTGDHVEVKGNRAYFLGRLNGSINVGGNKVMPEAVENVLLQHSAVALVAVSALRSPLMGNLVKAEIVAKPGCTPSDDLRRELTAHCRARLQPFQVPAIIAFVEALATSANGKIRRV